MDEATHTELGEDARFRHILTSPRVFIQHVRSRLLQLDKGSECYDETLEDFSRFLSFAASDIVPDGEAHSLALDAIYQEEIYDTFLDCVCRRAAWLEPDDWCEFGLQLQVMLGISLIC